MPFSLTSVKSIGIMASAVVAIFGAVTGFIPAVEAWDNFGFPTFATRNWSRVEFGSTKTEVKNISVDIARGKRDQNVIARNNLEITFATLADEQTKVKTQQEIRRLNETITALNEQIRALGGGLGPQ